jgi:hypothetical protein
VALVAMALVLVVWGVALVAMALVLVVVARVRSPLRQWLWDTLLANTSTNSTVVASLMTSRVDSIQYLLPLLVLRSPFFLWRVQREWRLPAFLVLWAMVATVATTVAELGVALVLENL